MKKLKKIILGTLTSMMLAVTSLVGLNENLNQNYTTYALDDSEMVYVGTPINPTESYQQLYFNTDLSVDYVNSLCSKFIYLDLSSFGMSSSCYPIYVHNALDFALLMDNNGDGTVNIYFVDSTVSLNDGLVPLFIGNSSLGLPVGWYQNGIDLFNSNYSLHSGIVGYEGYGEFVGVLNNYLYNVISTSSLEYVNINYTELVATAVEPLGHNDYYYFPTELSSNELSYYSSFLREYNYNTLQPNKMYYFYCESSDYTSGSISVIATFDNTSSDLIMIYSMGESNFGNSYGNYGEFNSLFSYLDIVPTDNIDINGVDVEVGQYNNELKGLCSSTPIYRRVKPLSENHTLIGGLLLAISGGIVGIMSPIIENIKDGFDRMFLEKNVSVGQAVSNTGKYDHLYFDTNLSKQEVDSVLSTLTYNVNNNRYMIYNGPFNSMYVEKSQNGYTIKYSGDGYSYVIYNIDGWSNTFDYNTDTLILSNGYTSVGLENELIKDIVSIVPVGVVTISVTTLGYFIFGMFGLSIAFGLVWLVISLFKKRG